jgi:hypothetical protein
MGASLIGLNVFPRRRRRSPIRYRQAELISFKIKVFPLQNRANVSANAAFCPGSPATTIPNQERPERAARMADPHNNRVLDRFWFARQTARNHWSDRSYLV